MSFSNTDTAGKTADPYTGKNLEEPTLPEKVQDLTAFMDRCKFCMMTTMTPKNLLASRCMALAAKVRTNQTPTSPTAAEESPHTNGTSQPHRKTTASTSSSTPTPSPAKPTT